MYISRGNKPLYWLGGLVFSDISGIKYTITEGEELSFFCVFADLAE
jgi:hypothetical protein